jgi:hypothetical protein
VLTEEWQANGQPGHRVAGAIESGPRLDSAPASKSESNSPFLSNKQPSIADASFTEELRRKKGASERQQMEPRRLEICMTQDRCLEPKYGPTDKR